MINSRNIIQAGQEAKYRIMIDREGFSQHENDFEVVLQWGMKGQELTIPKSEMMENERGEFFFVFPTKDMVGVVTARCTYYVPDMDYADGLREEVEQQPLCFVNTGVALPHIMDDGGIYDGRHVSYERQSQSNMKSIYVVLRDFSGKVLRDVNGFVLRALKKD